MVADIYSSWLDSVSHCCAPVVSFIEEARPRTYEQRIAVLRDQPGLVPPPSADPLWPSTRESGTHRVLKKSLGSSSGRGSTSLKRRLLSNSSASRRPQISAPTDFRHVYSESFQFPQRPLSPQARARPSSFRPLELSIYLPENHLSPLLPFFDYPNLSIAQPLPARTHGKFEDEPTLNHERSYSSMSFHVPRRPVRADSIQSQSQEENLPQVPPRARMRSYSSPSVEAIAERIASAIIEKEILQAEIDSVIERSSIYVSSRPSTGYGLPGGRDNFSSGRATPLTLAELEPMPSIPALPAAAPSFAERLSTERTPTQPHPSPRREESIDEADVSITPSSSEKDDRFLDRPLAPPLPLVLRPPLRKKKSFSRVSSWLFPGGVAENHRRDMSLDSITNLPKPVTGREGFYQCVAPPADIAERTSIDTVPTVSTWETEEDRTVPTSTWSPGSSPATKHGEPTPPLDRTAIAGVNRGNNGPQKASVGVAF